MGNSGAVKVRTVCRFWKIFGTILPWSYAKRSTGSYISAFSGIKVIHSMVQSSPVKVCTVRGKRLDKSGKSLDKSGKSPYTS